MFAGLNSHDRIQQKKRKKSKNCSSQKENKINFFFLKDRLQCNGKEENTCYTVMQQTKFLLHKKIKTHPFTSKTNAYCYSDENGEIKSGGEDSICAKENLHIGL